MAKTPDSGEYATHDEWLTVLGPWADLLDGVVTNGLKARSGDSDLVAPSASSAAIAERAAEEDLTGPWSESPIRSAHSRIRLLFTAAEDAMAAFAALTRLEATPLFAHLPVARSAVEALASARYLADPEIGPEERTRRYLNTELASSRSREMLSGHDDSDLRNRILEATALGFAVEKGRRKTTQFAPGLPTITAMIKDLLGEDLGRTFYGYTSAVAHGTAWGLMSVVAEGPGTAARDGHIAADLEIRGEDYQSLANGMLVAHHQSFRPYADHMGWDTAAYDAQFVQVLRTQRGEQSARARAPSGLWIPR